jgi:hypothetical protein
MSWLYKKGIKDGSPWIDYQEALFKVNPYLTFIFKIENYLSFILHEICVYYPSYGVQPQFPQVKVSAWVSSTSLQMMPKEVPAELFSSPSEDYTGGMSGILDSDACGMRLIPFTFNYPFFKGDILTVNVSGTTVPFNEDGVLVGVMIAGRKYGGAR